MSENNANLRSTFPSSAKAAMPQKPNSFIPKYPWGTIAVGKSFPVEYNEMKLTSLRPFAARMGKKYGKKFRVIDWKERKLYEVACIPMPQEQATATSSNVVEALNRMGDNNSLALGKIAGSPAEEATTLPWQKKGE